MKGAAAVAVAVFAVGVAAAALVWVRARPAQQRGHGTPAPVLPLEPVRVPGTVTGIVLGRPVIYRDAIVRKDYRGWKLYLADRAMGCNDAPYAVAGESWLDVDLPWAGLVVGRPFGVSLETGIGALFPPGGVFGPDEADLQLDPVGPRSSDGVALTAGMRLCATFHLAASGRGGDVASSAHIEGWVEARVCSVPDGVALALHDTVAPATPVAGVIRGARVTFPYAIARVDRAEIDSRPKVDNILLLQGALSCAEAQSSATLLDRGTVMLSGFSGAGRAAVRLGVAAPADATFLGHDWAFVDGERRAVVTWAAVSFEPDAHVRGSVTVSARDAEHPATRAELAGTFDAIVCPPASM